MTSSTFTCDWVQVKARLKKPLNFKSIFLHKKPTFLTQNFLRIPNMSTKFFYDVKKNWRHAFLLYIAMKTPNYLNIGIFKILCVGVSSFLTF